MASVSCQHVLLQVGMDMYLLCKYSHRFVCKDQTHVHATCELDRDHLLAGISGQNYCLYYKDSCSLYCSV